MPPRNYVTVSSKVLVSLDENEIPSYFKEDLSKGT